MGYFANGSDGDRYEAQYCDHCIHQNGPDGESGCAVWLAHLEFNHQGCNDKDSILHVLIPRGNGGRNEQCRMFVRRMPEVTP